MWVDGLDRAGSGQGQLAGICDCGNEPSGSINLWEFLDQLKTCQLLKKGSATWSKYELINTTSYGTQNTASKMQCVDIGADLQIKSVETRNHRTAARVPRLSCTRSDTIFLSAQTGEVNAHAQERNSQLSRRGQVQRPAVPGTPAIYRTWKQHGGVKARCLYFTSH